MRFARVAIVATFGLACGGETPAATTSPDHQGCTLISVTVSPASVVLGVGDSARLVATPPPPCGGYASRSAFVWQSSNASIVSVDSLGTIHARAGGDATIIAALVDDPNVKGASAIVVSPR